MSVDLEAIGQRMRTLSGALEASMKVLRERSIEYADADRDAKVAHAKAFLVADGTVAERQAQADLASADELHAAKLADGLRQGALEAVRSYRALISAEQSILAAHRAETEIDSYGPRIGP